MSFWKIIIILIVVSLLPLLSFYFGMVTQYNFSTFDTVTINWEMVSALGSILVPISLAGWALYSEKKKDERDKKETKRKEDRDTEIDRRSKLQHYYHNVICPLVKELENINQIRQDRRLEVPEKLALHSSQLYKDALSAEHEEHARIDCKNMVGYIGKIHMQISNIKKEVFIYQESYNKIQEYIQYITHIAMAIDLKPLYDQQVNEKTTLLILLFIGQVSLLVGVLESCVIYQVYDKEQEQDILQHLDTIMVEFLNNINQLTGSNFTLQK